MIHPSYSELIKVVNDGVEEGEEPVVTSRYSIVLATSRRARQIIGSSNAEEITQGKKPLSVAVDELYKGKIKILTEEEAEQVMAEKEARRAAEEMMLSLEEEPSEEIVLEESEMDIEEEIEEEE